MYASLLCPLHLCPWLTHLSSASLLCIFIQLRNSLQGHATVTTVILLNDGTQALAEVSSLDEARHLVEELGQMTIG